MQRLPGRSHLPICQLTGVEFILFLCGYFDSGYLGYEAAEGIDWIWAHRACLNRSDSVMVTGLRLPCCRGHLLPVNDHDGVQAVFQERQGYGHAAEVAQQLARCAVLRRGGSLLGCAG
jgi:hypothetical protein